MPPSRKGVEARDPAFREVVRASFDRQAFMATLGARLESVEPGLVEISAPYSELHTQQNGYLHAGVVTSIADSACGYAALSLAPPGHDVLAVEFKINLLAPARAPRLLAVGRVLRAGRTLTVSQAEVFGIDADRRELVATMLATVIARPLRADGA
jgi:uncharacterized protein (TIGR00369 family)